MMQPRLRTRILALGFRSGRFRRRSSAAERLDVPHQLPAPGFRQLGPNRHFLSNHPIGQQPEKSSGRCALDLWNKETGSFARAFGGVTVAFRAMLFEENRAGSNFVCIVLQWVRTLPPPPV